ncbi:MAG: GIY-YIG nuclease family protein [Anaerolineae bacterium]
MSPPQSPVVRVGPPLCRDALPPASGVYALHMVLHAPCQVALRGHDVSLPAGGYLYVGSARGSGGLRARLGRHVAGSGRLHWHIDHLRGHAEIVAAYYCLSPAPLECAWVRALLSLPDVTAPAPGFGASDCRARCPAHLLRCAAPLDDVHAALEAAALRAAP